MLRNTGYQKSLLLVFCHVEYKHCIHSHFFNLKYNYNKRDSTEKKASLTLFNSGRQRLIYRALYNKKDKILIRYKIFHVENSYT